MASSCRGYSKAQMCLFKILHIISSTPPSKDQPFPLPDLNLIFCSVGETTADSEESSRSNNASVTAQPNNNNNNIIEEEEEAFPEKSVEEVSEKVDNNNNNVNQVDNHVETASFKGRDGNSNCFDLLIEAARVVSAKDESDSEELGSDLTTRSASKEKRREKWVVVDLYGGVLEEREPVVRSKRGRSQALPYRFRDSVVEPLKRATRSQRPSSTAHLTKRLLRSSPTT